MLNPKQVSLLRRRVKRLVRASVEYSWRGAQESAATTMIETELIRATQMYEQLLKTLTVYGN